MIFENSMLSGILNYYFFQRYVFYSKIKNNVSLSLLLLLFFRRYLYLIFNCNFLFYSSWVIFICMNKNVLRLLYFQSSCHLFLNFAITYIFSISAIQNKVCKKGRTPLRSIKTLSGAGFFGWYRNVCGD